MISLSVESGRSPDMPIIDARYYKTLVICPNRTMAAELGPVLSNGLPLAPVTNIQSYPNRRQLVDLLKSADPKLCFLDFSDAEHGAAVLSDLLQVKPNLPVIALLPSGNADLMLKCVRSGASDLLVRPFASDQMDAAVEKVARLNPAPASGRGKGGKVIGVFPAKGACGASTIATSLAFQARRAGSKKVVLCDLDPLTGTIPFLLKLKTTHSFLDVLTRMDSLDDDLWKQMVTTTQHVDVLLSPETIMEGLDQLQDASAIIEFAQNQYDTVVLDCGSPYGPWNISCARLSDELVLLTTNELSTLQAAQRALAYLDHHRIDSSRVRLVINRYSKELGLTPEAISSAIGLEVCHTIPSDYETVQRSLIEGKPIPSGSMFGKNIAALAERLIGGNKNNEKGDGGKKSVGILSLFSRASS
jgi:pilus assembly protein CpaE